MLVFTIRCGVLVCLKFLPLLILKVRHHGLCFGGDDLPASIRLDCQHDLLRRIYVTHQAEDIYHCDVGTDCGGAYKSYCFCNPITIGVRDP